MTFPLSGKRVFWYFVAFFLTVAAVNAVMVTIALRTNTGIVTEHPYETGLAYNKIVAAEEKQEELGWKGQIDYKNGVLYFQLQDHDGKTIIPQKSTATLTRPIQAGMDFTAELIDGKAEIAFPVKGLWEIRIDSLYKDTHYQKSKRIVVE